MLKNNLDAYTKNSNSSWGDQVTMFMMSYVQAPKTSQYKMATEFQDSTWNQIWWKAKVLSIGSDLLLILTCKFSRVVRIWR